MATLSGLVDDVYTMLYGVAQAERPQEDTLATAVSDSSDTTWRFTTTTMWKRGDYAEAADTSGEIVIMTEDHPSGSDVTVRRGQRGTTKASSYSSGQVFYKNPTFPRFEIERLINQVVRNDLWPDVWSWHKDTLSFVAGTYVYALDQYVEDVVAVYQYDLSSDGRLWPLPRTWWDVERQVATTVATNSLALRIRTVKDEASTVYYTAKRRPDPNDLANMSDEVAELVPWAVVGKLGAGDRAAAVRHNPQRDRSDQTEGGPFRDYRGFMAEFLRMKNDLNKKLRTEVPQERIYRPKRRRRAW